MTTAIVERTITAFLDGDDSLEINNIIHSTAGAARYGYTGPLVGGTTVYSWCIGALVEALGDAWLDEGWVEFQLRKPVYPGEEITTRVTVRRRRCRFHHDQAQRRHRRPRHRRARHRRLQRGDHRGNRSYPDPAIFGSPPSSPGRSPRSAKTCRPCRST